jgi:hypothetical protein
VRARERTSADRRASDVSDQGGHTDRSGPAPGDTGTDRRAQTQGARARSGTPRSWSCDRDRTREIKPGGGERLRAAPLLFAAAKSSELGQVRAMAVPGSPELVKEGEDDSASSMAWLWPRDRGQRGENSGEKASGGSE